MEWTLAGGILFMMCGGVWRNDQERKKHLNGGEIL